MVSSGLDKYIIWLKCAEVLMFFIDHPVEALFSLFSSGFLLLTQAVNALEAFASVNQGTTQEIHPQTPEMDHSPRQRKSIITLNGQ